MAPPSQTTSSNPNPPHRRPRPPHSRQTKPKSASPFPTTSFTPAHTSLASSTKSASPVVIQAQMERVKGPLMSPPSSEIDIDLTTTTGTKSKVAFKEKLDREKRRTSTRKVHMTSPAPPLHTTTSVTSVKPAQTVLPMDKSHEVLNNRKRAIKIVNPADREPRDEAKVKAILDPPSQSKKPDSVDAAIPSFYDASPAYATPTMPVYQGYQQHSPSTPPRFRNLNNAWGSNGSPYGTVHGRDTSMYHDSPSARSTYETEKYVGGFIPDRRLDPPPELLRTAAPTPTMSTFERRSRLYALMPDLKTLQESDYPPPSPYNAAFPHPISAYASPGVNQHSLAASGYLDMLRDLVQNEPNRLKGSILTSASVKEDLWPPALDMVLPGDDGCGIPERLFVQFDSLGAARISVGNATPAPYARIKPLSGSPPLGQSRLDGQYSIGHSQDEFVVSHFTSRRPPLPDQAAWRRESQSSHLLSYEPLAIDRRDTLGRGEMSAEFKTELCPVWEDTGLCKYGKSCQFAHGFNELRTPTRIIPLPSPPMERAALHDEYLPEGTYPFPTPTSQRKGSLPSIPILPRLDIRRASAPPRDLAVVTEMDDHPTFWQQEDIPPIGAERVTPPRERPRAPLPNLGPSFAWQGYDFDSFASPTTRPAALNPFTRQEPRPQQDLQNSFSSLSSSSARSTSYATSCETNSNTWSPGNKMSTQAGSYGSKGHNEHIEGNVGWSRSSASTSLDFSTGRSIWC